ncbi:hypothetical protein Aeqsu_1799 [Aequorivita sublithincola DSM 14238]|uniref:Tetratricopeptide repeat protein n=1 Tax=Aequorivita sublithincola (strain DSM 14238 / LMG 21431 / ACAM 643 / 9-3) TaxID=746697 RepID=I3YWB0_AEQSU|nr:hypothetical protein [Aequorivita sublithincola]AFL81278.1 hypothetical protein Aeqsu_1799 [Aequorivita sublithincola DSM 14238]
MNYWKLYISVFFFASTIALAAEKPKVFCGYFPEYEEVYYPIIDQKIIGDASLYPFLNCPWSTFCESPGTLTASQENFEDWRKFFGNNLSEQVLQQFIYNETADWYQKLAENNANIINGIMAKKINKSLQKPFAKYMLLAKKCEGISSNNSGGGGWYQGEENDGYDEKPELLELALKNYKAETNAFLKNRYGYQIVRLAHYLQENEAALNYFDSFLKLDKETPYIYYLALEQKSGAAYNLKKLQESAKGFLEVYTKVPSRRRSCALSLRYLDWSNPQLNDEFFAEAGFAEIESFFKSYYFNGSISREMQKLQKNNPNSPYLEVLAIRQVDRLQNRLFKNQYDGYYGYSENKEDTNSKWLQEIAKSQIANLNVQRKDFWRIVLSASYLEVNDYKNAASSVAEISKNSEMYIQAKRLSFSIDVLNLKTVDRKEIGNLFSRLKADKQLYESRPLTAFFFNSISDLYKKDGNVIVSLLGSLNYYMESSEYDWEQLETNLGNNWKLHFKNELVDDEIITKLQNFIDLPAKSEYEKLVISKIKASPQDYANELRGTWFFQRNDLDQAISYFKKIENPNVFYEKNFRPELFSGAINEYFDTPFSQQSDKIHLKYKTLFAEDIQKNDRDENYADNKLKLAETFQKLEKLAKSDPQNAADYYYMLGNAWYNMSDAGWFLNTLQYLGNNERNHVLDYDSYNEGEQKSKNSSFDIYATNYFEKSRAANGSKETKAKATFMLAKTNYCFNVERNADYKYRVIVCRDHKEYFKSLRTNYSDTNFEAQVIRECSWYRNYLSE